MVGARVAALSAAVAVTATAVGARLTHEFEVADARAGERPRVTGAAPSAAPTSTSAPAPPSAPARPTASARSSREVGPAPPRPPQPIPESGSGHFDIAPGGSTPTGTGLTVTYSVEVEEGLPYTPADIADVVDRVLGDDRGWTAVMSRSLQRVSSTPTFRIRLATPETADALCAPLDTDGRLSCRNGEMVVLNAWRWASGAHAYGDDLRGYRVYMVNHEFGHALGNGHVACPKVGTPAPVMVQQTKDLEGCTSNPWPTAG